MRPSLNLILFITFLFLYLSMDAAAQSLSVLKNYITVKGDQLYDGDRPFRFISYNIPNLLTVEDNMSFQETNPWRLPDAYEIEDALKTIKQMAGQVARTYVITVRRDTDSKDMVKFVEGPGQFNEEAFRTMDQVLATANRVGIRLIIPLVDNWKWMGGKPQYAAFRGKTENDFWTDQQIKNDYKATVAYILNRVNTITGIAYKEDKAILAWELGNEIHQAPIDWIVDMASFIKSIDSYHLLNDGIQSATLPDEILEIKQIDILSTHHYEQNPDEMRAHISESMQKAKGKKPYYIGEFGFISTSAVKAILEQIQSNTSISGGLIWSLRFHNRDGGFYWHSEPLGGGLYKAYHWPGFVSGQAYDEKNLMALMKDYALAISEEIPSDTLLPDPPKLLPSSDVCRISWQGSVGAARYIIERSKSDKGPWEIIATEASDADVAYAPLYNDHSAQINHHYYYRLKAANFFGSSKPSNVIGPIQAGHKTIVDEMENFAVLYHYEGPLKLENGSTRTFKEDFNRLSAKKGAKMIYYAPGPLLKIRLYSYSPDPQADVEISGSEDGQKYYPAETSVKDYFTGQLDYDYWHPLLIEAEFSGKKVTYVKIDFKDDGQIGKVEVLYGR